MSRLSDPERQDLIDSYDEELEMELDDDLISEFLME